MPAGWDGRHLVSSHSNDFCCLGKANEAATTNLSGYGFGAGRQAGSKSTSRSSVRRVRLAPLTVEK